jgi:HrpA-like RNA helicase
MYLLLLNLVFRNAARKDQQEGYKTLVEGTPVHIHPTSALFQKQPEWVLYHELVLTSKEYMRESLSIEPKWLTEVAPNFFKQVIGGLNNIRLMLIKFHSANKNRP